MRILAERNLIVLNQGRMLYDQSFTLPYDGIGWLHFEFFEQEAKPIYSQMQSLLGPQKSFNLP